MKTSKSFLPFTFLLLLLAACGGDSDGGSNAPQQEEAPPTTTGGTSGGGGTTGGTTGGGTANFDVVLDSELTQAERLAMNNSIDRLEKLQIDGSKVAGFASVFKGNRSSNVVSYLEARVNYVVSQYTNHANRLVYPLSSPALKLYDFFASNDSVGFWYFDKFYEQEGGVKYIISNRARDISSSQIGVIQLGNIFTNYNAVTQAITLVHEARHSDCPDGAILSDVLSVVQSGGQYGGVQNPECGQLHFGPGGGDSFAWGPYLIDYLYSIAIARTCSNCTQTEIDEAQTNANDVQGRVFDLNGTINGNYGQPDMSNSTTVRDDL